MLLLGLCVSASAYDSAHVFDYAGLLTESEAGALEARCQEAEDIYGCGVYIVTVDDYSLYYDAGSIESFSEGFFLDFELGTGEDQNGILLALSMAERDYDLCAHGEIGNRAFTDYGKGVLAERYFLIEFGGDNWYAGFDRYVDGCTDFLQTGAGRALRPGDRPRASGGYQGAQVAGCDFCAAADGADRLPCHEGQNEDRP